MGLSLPAEAGGVFGRAENPPLGVPVRRHITRQLFTVTGPASHYQLPFLPLCYEGAVTLAARKYMSGR
jgi:hypothetical protein